MGYTIKFEQYEIKCDKCGHSEEHERKHGEPRPERDWSHVNAESWVIGVENFHPVRFVGILCPECFEAFGLKGS